MQGTLSLLPGRQRVNRVFQKHVTHSLDLTDSYLLGKWERTQAHAQGWLKHGRSRHPDDERFVAVEIGTGWFPVTSVGLVLCGAERVRTYDVKALADRPSVLAVMSSFDRLIRDGVIDPPSQVGRERLELALSEPEGRPGHELLALLGVDVHIRDPRDTGLPDRGVDLVVSTSKLEHISPGPMRWLLHEIERITAVGGIMSHVIDMADHYAQLDDTINRFNFLRYGKRRWKLLYNNQLHFQNRLRVNDYRKMFEDLAWEIVDEHDVSRPAAELAEIPVHRDFAHYRQEDLLVTEAHISCRRQETDDLPD
ncbi:MAG: hypothetical protein GEV07_30220 [Streptosporangiales bacterium]|nr:hypothetical protein [Streptosporangiales bacterium]